MVSIRSRTKGHMLVTCKPAWADVAKAAGHPDPWTHASCTTPRQPSGRQGANPWTDGYLAQSGKNRSSTTSRCPRRLTLISNVPSGREPEECGPPQQASALPFLRFAELSDPVAPLVPTRPCHPRACASSLAALCPVHLHQAQHRWATEFARTNGKSLSNAALSLPRRAALRPRYKSASRCARQPASSACRWTRQRECFGTLGTPSGAIGTMCLASCGIDVWEIQLHGRWTCDSLRWHCACRWKHNCRVHARFLSFKIFSSTH